MNWFAHSWEGENPVSTPPPNIDLIGRRAQRRAERRTAAARRPYPYRIDVHGLDVADVVESIGGWLFDQAMAGWYVDVDVDGPKDEQPLHILGIRSHRPLTVATPEQRITVVVAARLLDIDHGVRTKVTAALRGGDNVIVWGTTGDAERRYRLSDVSYRPSAAALAFKAHALRAAGTAMNSAESKESFRVQPAPDCTPVPDDEHSSGDADPLVALQRAPHPHETLPGALR